MGQPSFHAATRLRITIGLLILTIACVPALIRATERPHAQTGSPLKVRLNRGFDVPKLKSRVAPPAWRHLASRSIELTDKLPPLQLLRPIIDIGIPRSSARTAPEVLRGPPLTATLLS